MKIYGRIDMRGKFWVQRATRITDLIWTAAAISRIVYSKEDDSIWFGGKTRWRQITHGTDLVNTGQKMIFMSYPLPVDWTIEDTGNNDKSIMVTNNNTQIGDSGGSWTITGMNTQDTRHTHFAPNGFGLPTTGRAVGASEIYTSGSNMSHRHYMSYDSLHSHAFDGSWRPHHVKGIVGVYNGV